MIGRQPGETSDFGCRRVWLRSKHASDLRIEEAGKAILFRFLDQVFDREQIER
jgi:hypothetical protein